MRRFFPACLPVLMLALAAPVPAQAQDKPSANPYYPLKVGHEWTYQSGKESVVIRVEKTVPLELMRDDKIDRATSYILKVSSGPREVSEQVAVLADGVYRFSTAGKNLKPALRFFKFPPAVGDSWMVDCKTDDGKVIRGKYVAGTETIQVMIGRNLIELKTVTVTGQDFLFDGQTMATKSWFAENYGLVKQHVRIGKHEVELELREFKEAK